MIKFISELPKKIVLSLIGLYQVTLSPDHGFFRARFPHGYCRFYPSCSDYARQSIINFGLIKGGYLGAKRVLRCHPWAEPKFDPVPRT
ncbi:MAG: membrane protein insertion efficiency factor YidD [Candidatus Doudnabacteria bacterium]|nr:membrane protein insertion efficiency factor YidD [Candidatus Doudnabacteria bacterium]